MRRVSLLLVLALLIPSTALAKKKYKKSSSEPVAEPAVQEAAPEVSIFQPPEWAPEVPAEGVLVRVLDPGAEPREPLRLAPQVGASAEMSMVMEMGMGMSMMGMPMMEMALPTQRMVMRFQVEEVDAEGRIRTTSRLTGYSMDADGDMPGMDTEDLNQRLSGLVGLTGTVVTDDRGRPVSSVFEVPPDLDPELQDQLGQVEQQAGTMAYPFPEEPVGVGARWEVLKQTRNNGMVVLERSVATLSSRDGSRYVLETAIEQSLATGDVELPNLPPGAEMQVTRFASAGTARTEGLLDAVIPDVGDARMELDMAFQANAEGQSMDMAMDMDIHILMTRQ